MHLYVFGAGASQGSQQRGVPTLLKAPLVNELFANQYKDYAKDVALLNVELQSLRVSIGKGSVEEWLTNEWDRINALHTATSRQGWKTLFGKLVFYIWRLFLGVSESYFEMNLYRVFATKLRERDEEFALISFNYDTLLDRAVHSVLGANLTGLNGYYETPFLKPHGSVNWLLGRRGDDPVFAIEQQGEPDYKSRFQLASSQMFSGRPISWDQLHIIPPDHEHLAHYKLVFSRVGMQYFYPLVLIPLTVKMYSFMPDLPAEMIRRGQQLFAKAEDVYLIGYRAIDEIFGDMVKNVRPGTRLHIIGRATANDVAKRVLAKCPDMQQASIHKDGFRGFLDTVM